MRRLLGLLLALAALPALMSTSTARAQAPPFTVEAALLTSADLSPVWIPSFVQAPAVRAIQLCGDTPLFPAAARLSGEAWFVEAHTVGLLTSTGERLTFIGDRLTHAVAVLPPGAAESYIDRLEALPSNCVWQDVSGAGLSLSRVSFGLVADETVAFNVVARVGPLASTQQIVVIRLRDAVAILVLLSPGDGPVSAERMQEIANRAGILLGRLNE